MNDNKINTNNKFNNSFIFDIPELEEDEPVKRPSKYGSKIKPMTLSQNSNNSDKATHADSSISKQLEI